jgi:hypothetical protein
VTLALAILIVLVATAIGIGVMLLVRRGAPEGSYFEDGDRAAGVFGVLATGFSILLGFVIFLAFENYDESRAGAEAEALVVAQQVETARFFGEPAATQLTGELVCYARYVTSIEWERLENGTLGDSLNPWAVRLLRTLERVEPKTSSQQSAYDKWLEQTSTREEGRLDRTHGAAGVIPAPLWIVLFLVAGVIFAFMLFFADSGERKRSQAVLMGSVVATIAAMFLLLNFFDNPYRPGVGALRPIAMERTLRVVDEALAALNVEQEFPCDERGDPR